MKNQNVTRPSENPTVRGENMSKHLDGIVAYRVLRIYIEVKVVLLGNWFRERNYCGMSELQI